MADNHAASADPEKLLLPMFITSLSFELVHLFWLHFLV